MISHFKLYQEFVCSTCPKKSMTHVHFLKTFINYKSLKGNVTQSKKLHVQDEKSNNDIDEDRNNDNDVIDEGLKNEAIHEFLFPGSVCAIYSSQ